MKNASKIIGLTLLILLALEAMAWIWLNRTCQSLPFFYSPSTPPVNLGKFNYCQIDPLLGWDIGNPKTYQHSKGCILLQPAIKTNKPFVVYISGGSTTDLLYDSLNWPALLHKKILQNQLPIQIQLASVAGYNSGQELLKLLRFNPPAPNLHLSYSGANEIENPDFVSSYEQSIYQQALYPKPSKFLPNLVHLLRPKSTLVLSKPFRNKPSSYWLNNMKTMNNLAVAQGYSFVGILQPVAGVSCKIPDSIAPGALQYLKLYPDFYGSVRMEIPKLNYLLDLSSSFQNETESPFLDDCHLKNKLYQQQIANRIYEVIVKHYNEKRNETNE
ncbi:MAG: hypothetical protein K1X82_08595 [Bacteroidia bacterium]|nr:hypothetical protein [Bacteroidia bacterium]